MRGYSRRVGRGLGVLAVVTALVLSGSARPAVAATNTGLKVTAWSGPTRVPLGTAVGYTVTITNFSGVGSSPFVLAWSFTTSGNSGVFTSCALPYWLYDLTDPAYIACFGDGVTIAAGASRTFAFTWYTDVPGRHVIRLGVQSDLDETIYTDDVIDVVVNADPPLPNRPPAIIALGDSFISGEGGRWAGNAEPGGIFSTAQNETDRAYTSFAGPIPALVYGSTAGQGGCHRADVAAIRNTTIPGQAINVACSGAQTVHLLSAPTGGVAFKGERQQIEQLRHHAALYRVTFIAVSIGGNDLGFRSIIESCVTAYSTSQTPCRTAQQANANARMPGMVYSVGRVIDDIRAVMASLGYAANSYRLVLQGYPSPVPRAAEMRYAQGSSGRIKYGCPLYDTDLTWARDTLVNQINDNLRSLATTKGVDFIDMRNLLQGREVCSALSRPVGPPDNPHPNDVKSVWVRILYPLGEMQQESFHPNAYGHLAQGRCLSLIYSKPVGRYSCINTAGVGVTAGTKLQ